MALNSMLTRIIVVVRVSLGCGRHLLVRRMALGAESVRAGAMRRTKSPPSSATLQVNEDPRRLPLALPTNISH